MTTTQEVSDIQTRLEQLKQGTPPSFEDIEFLKQREPEVAALYLQWLQEQTALPNTPEDQTPNGVENPPLTPSVEPSPEQTAENDSTSQEPIKRLNLKETIDLLKELSEDINFQTEADFHPEIQPSGRLYQKPKDAIVISPDRLETLTQDTEEWRLFAGVLNQLPFTVWRDPRKRPDSNVDYIIIALHEEGIIYIRIRAVET